MTDDGVAAVRVLLDAAGIHPDDREVLGLGRVYRQLRAQADQLYVPEVDAEGPALTYDPLAQR